MGSWEARNSGVCVGWIYIYIYIYRSKGFAWFFVSKTKPHNRGGPPLHHHGA